MSELSSKDLIHDFLSPNVNLLGRILGYVIKSQAGEEYFELEEKVRMLSKRFRENQDENAAQELTDILSKLKPDERTVIIRAFSLFFQLVNLAEDEFKITLNRIRSESQTTHKLDTFQGAVQFAKDQGYSVEQLLDLLRTQSTQLVWTAHPTEARRLTVLLKLRKIYNLLQEYNTPNLNAFERQPILEKIEEQVTLLWQTDDLRESKVQILDEVRTNLFYFDQSLFDILPDLYNNLLRTIKSEYSNNVEIEIPHFLTYGSWVGGDRDGHPGVTSEITIQTLLLHKRLCLRKYHESIQTLLQDLSSSINMIAISDELSESIKQDALLFPEFTAQTLRLNKLEPYRRKLDYIRLKLENTLTEVEKEAVEVGLGTTMVGAKQGQLVTRGRTFYLRSQEFVNDLEIIRNSLNEHKGKSIAYGALNRLLTQVSIFGFHLAPLDLRQDSGIHRKVMGEIFEKIGFPDFIQLNKEEQAKMLEKELVNPRPLGTRNLENLSELAHELLSTFEVAKASLDTISPRSIGTYIMSMSTHEADVYTTLLFMKEIGILTVSQGKVISGPISIAPLFETKEDLANASTVMEKLFANDLYRSLLELQGNIQEIMIGYSDSTKDVGFMESNFRLLMAQKELLELSEKYNIQLRIFHGRGGSISRGGGPTNESILSQLPNGTSNMKITEQGEVIGYTYFNPQIAYRHLEQIFSAIIIHGVNDSLFKSDKNPNYVKLDNLAILEKIANKAREGYESLVKKDPNFIEFYLQFTPLDLIERATIGSRPSRRSSSNVKDITGLRAIPWIFSWMQSRLILPAFYGIGASLKEYTDENGIEPLQNLYKNWKYFRTLINNLQMILLKTDVSIAKRYRKLVTKSPQIFDKILQEYELTRKYILSITGYNELLDNSPSIQESITRRNPYVDPLNLIQIELLAHWRENGYLEDMSPTSELRHLLQTVNGIAAGLRNTG